MEEELHEANESLWRLVAAPAVWAVHLLLAYCTAAIGCVKVAGPGGSLAPARVAIAGYTGVALLAIVRLGWKGYKRHRYRDSTLPHDFDSPADRHRLLGFATLLLAGLSVVAVVYQALPALFIGSCR